MCDALELQNTGMAVAGIAAEDKHQQSLGLRGSAPWLVNESGLYTLIMRSRKPEAVKFQRWVTSEVLPAIRKTGMYVAPAAQATAPTSEDPLDLVARALLVAPT